ncbi:Outward-rectifier potassium channel TOK1 [Ceratobasidium theobromae]|uniref:Outward-rectifier potassium channel TOK1 n=1 Tax=Ceratobasidium theobromae TaxID=1582974 RepID=A0A5N5QE74_9AGAM|nr:Outward-rectifier potassium channel TOK1 [Ceratobasidium theobromae]
MSSATLSTIDRFASISPLTASLIAPLAVLLDIPALTEHWYTRNHEPQPDPRASLILSGLSLGFSLIANALLVVRFSLRGRGWRIATQFSVACWIVKVATGITNLVVFGALTRNQPEFSYAEGFWSAVISLIGSGIILSLLVLHWVVEFQWNRPNDDLPSGSTNAKLQMRVAGRHFMLQNTLLIALISLTALIFSRIGIYFTIVTFLTVGFGDFYPTKIYSKIILFPLGLLGMYHRTLLVGFGLTPITGITLLAGCVSMIVSFLNDHRKEHKAKVRAEREKAWQMSQMSSEDPSLEREITFLRKLHERQGWCEQAIDLAKSLGAFLAFWFAGAAIFGAVESWSYGDGLYFCYVFFLSIGYGDFAPVSPAGRVIFIVYSVMAVYAFLFYFDVLPPAYHQLSPIMASFAVQAIQNIIERMSSKRMDQRRAHAIDHANSESKLTQNSKKDVENNLVKQEVDQMHSDLILWHHSRYQAVEEGTEVTIRAEDLDALLKHVVALERTTRRLLVANLKEGSFPQILLRADWNLQLRNLEALKSELKESSTQSQGMVDGGRCANGQGTHLVATEASITGDSEEHERREEAEITTAALGGMDEEAILQAVRDFRKNVAGILALGSRLRGLEGTEKYMFERRRKEVEKKAK